MIENTLASLEGIADVERIDGRDADPAAPPCLLVEVPHGAESRAEYDALRARLVGDLPADLHIFYHVNTDVGAYGYGRRTAERVIAADASRSALIVRAKIPRTFIDVNRVESAGDELAKGGLTPGIPPYVRDERDVALLLELHRAYVRIAERAYELVCRSGGFALSPHTYGPRTMGIERIDDSIVQALRDAHEPEAWARWPERPPIDLITATPEGVSYAPDGMPERLLQAFRALDIDAVANGTYTLHPATQGFRFCTRYPAQVLCLEVRRDLLVERYAPFDEMRVRADAADRIAAPLADAIDAWLRA